MHLFLKLSTLDFELFNFIELTAIQNQMFPGIKRNGILLKSASNFVLYCFSLTAKVRLADYACLQFRIKEIRTNKVQN